MTYVEELEKFIKVMEKDYDLPDYFAKQFLDFKQEKHGENKKKIGIIGDNFYSLYAKAYGLKPILINGGSYFTGENTDVFPQISDPIAKSSVGLLLDPNYNLAKELDAILVVALNDSYKKAIAYLKEMGLNVIQVEPIPYINEKLPFALYKQQLMAINDISKLVLGVFNEATFKKELKSYKNAYKLVNDNRFKALPSVTQCYLINILHTVWDKNEWCSEVTKYLSNKSDLVPPTQVTIMGSAIHIPNSKLFQICQDLGINYFDNECNDLPNYSNMDIRGGGLCLLNRAFSFQHRNAFIPATLGDIESVELPTNTFGIIYYLLKGQISDAYYAERMEELAIEQGIPFICVETDYTYTDSEQLKIRIEAFYEMLFKNKVK